MGLFQGLVEGKVGIAKQLTSAAVWSVVVVENSLARRLGGMVERTSVVTVKGAEGEGRRAREVQLSRGGGKVAAMQVRSERQRRRRRLQRRRRRRRQQKQLAMVKIEVDRSHRQTVSTNQPHRKMEQRKTHATNRASG